MLRVRSAVLSDRVIQIRGLGSYLTYFDGATRSHLDAVVHTRQSMPPVSMEAIAVTATVTSLALSKAASIGQFQIDLTVVAERKTKVICMVDFQSTHFQQLVHQCETDHRQSVARLFATIAGCREDDLPTTPTMFPNFQRAECCRFECLISEVDGGEHSVSLPLLFTMNDWLNDRLRAYPAQKAASGEATDEKVTVAVMLVPIDDHRRSQGRRKGRGKGTAYSWRGGGHSAELGECGTIQQQPIVSSGATNGTACDEDCGAGEEGDLDLDLDLSDAPEDTPLRSYSPQETRSAAIPVSTPGSGSNRNPMTAAIPSSAPSPVVPPAARSHNMFAAVFAHSLSLSSLADMASVAADAGPSPTATQTVALVSEVLVLDRHCRLFASQEIFGLGASHPTGGSATSPESTTASSGVAVVPPVQAAEMPTSPTRRAAQAVSAGGRLVPEDCVVCLSAPKAVLLLPCRHLCVCDACLVFLDKCPVCRAGFEEYISISGESAAPLGGDSVPSGAVLRI